MAKRQDRDGDGVWTTAASDNWYYLTDVMFSVRGIADRNGDIHTRVDYTPYGVALHRYAADVDGNNLINFFDLSAFITNYNSGTPLKPGDANYDPDTDLNGDQIGALGAGANFFEVQAFQMGRYTPYSSGGSNPTTNTGWIDNPTDVNGPDNSVGYDGYWFDLAGATDAGSTGLYCVRHRTYDPALGRWLERDPWQFVDGMGLYQYARSRPIVLIDSSGLVPSCPETEPPAPSGCSNDPALTDNWCKDTAGGGHCGLSCYRSYGSINTGISSQQCCYNADGSLNTDPDCMGSIDISGTADTENSKGNCTILPGGVILHVIFDVVPWVLDKRYYNEIQCCIRGKGASSGSSSGMTDSDTLKVLRKECKKEIAKIRRMGFESDYCNKFQRRPPPNYPILGPQPPQIDWNDNVIIIEP